MLLLCDKHATKVILIEKVVLGEQKKGDDNSTYFCYGGELQTQNMGTK